MVQDVSHRTGQGVGHTLVEVTEKHKDMAEGRGRRSGRHNGGNKKRGDVEGEEEGVRNGGRMLQRVQKTREDLGGDGGTWHREKVKSRGGNCEGKVAASRGLEGRG